MHPQPSAPAAHTAPRSAAVCTMHPQPRARACAHRVVAVGLRGRQRLIRRLSCFCSPPLSSVPATSIWARWRGVPRAARHGDGEVEEAQAMTVKSEKMSKYAIKGR